jgi:hypothetical protein
MFVIRGPGGGSLANHAQVDPSKDHSPGAPAASADADDVAGAAGPTPHGVGELAFEAGVMLHATSSEVVMKRAIVMFRELMTTAD